MLHTQLTDAVQYGVAQLPPLGYLCVVQTSKGLCALFWRDNERAVLEEAKSLFPHGKHDKTAPFVALAFQELKAYCKGQLREFTVPLDLRGTAFRQRVWQVLQDIPYGKTLAYSDVALAVQNPKGVRAVAQACGANPVGIIVPCHRVIGKNGSLTGYANGLEHKKHLLELEGALPKDLLS